MWPVPKEKCYDVDIKRTRDAVLRKWTIPTKWATAITEHRSRNGVPCIRLFHRAFDRLKMEDTWCLAFWKIGPSEFILLQFGEGRSSRDMWEGRDFGKLWPVTPVFPDVDRDGYHKLVPRIPSLRRDPP